MANTNQYLSFIPLNTLIFPLVHGLTFPGVINDPRQVHGVFSTKISLTFATQNPCQEFVSE